MHGLVNRSIQCFLQDSFGPDIWKEIAARAGLPEQGFEAMLVYDDRLTTAMLAAAGQRLQREEGALLEDLGTFLVSHPSNHWLRRLLRFGGGTFIDFLHSLDQLQDRGRLAVPDLDLPALELEETAPGRFTLWCRHARPGYGHVMVGVLRAMADDYGALVLLDHRSGVIHAGDGPGVAREEITIDVAAAVFSEGRRFELAAG